MSRVARGTNPLGHHSRNTAGLDSWRGTVFEDWGAPLVVGETLQAEVVAR